MYYEVPGLYAWSISLKIITKLGSGLSLVQLNNGQVKSQSFGARTPRSNVESRDVNVELNILPG